MTERLNDQPDEIPPLDLKGNAERLPMYERLATALHNMRVVRLGETDTEELEAVKEVAEADTTELKLPRIPNQPKSRGDERTAKRLEEREDRERRHMRARDAMRHLRRDQR